jgi:hypothetical protein
LNAKHQEKYVTTCEEAGLTALIRRHGPMVWSVCRRVLYSHHDAEDAFQATFLVLARKAASIVPRELVANWLYGVAHQTALKARVTAAIAGNRWSKGTWQLGAAHRGAGACSLNKMSAKIVMGPNSPCRVGDNNW